MTARQPNVTGWWRWRMASDEIPTADGDTGSATRPLRTCLVLDVLLP